MGIIGLFLMLAAEGEDLASPVPASWLRKATASRTQSKEYALGIVGNRQSKLSQPKVMKFHLTTSVPTPPSVKISSSRA